MFTPKINWIVNSGEREEVQFAGWSRNFVYPVTSGVFEVKSIYRERRAN
jgi:hypothetical protein